MKSCVLSIIVAFVISSLLLATPVLAQGKKESAKPLSPKKSEQPNIEKWAEAYKRDERPKILVLCGWATGAQQANDPGNVLWNVDTGGTCGSIRTSFRGVLNHPSADVEMVADDALRFAMERLQGTLNLRNEKEAVNLLMRNLTAELGIIIRLYDPKNGVPGRVIVESMMLDRARMAFEISFNWYGDVSQPNINENCEQLARAFIDDFADRQSSDVLRTTVRVLGLMKSEDLVATRGCFKKTAGVREVKKNSGDTGNHDAVSEFEVTYDRALGSDDLAESLVTNLGNALQCEITIVKEEGRALNLRVSPKDKPAPTFVASCEESIAEEGGVQFRARFEQLYKEKDSPRIAILMNRAATKEEKESEPPGVTAENLIVVTAGGRDAATGVGAGSAAGERPAGNSGFFTPQELEFQARDLERELAHCFNGKYVKFTTVDVDRMREILAKRADHGRSVLQQTELVEILKQEDIADVLIIGYGRSDACRAGADMRYTVKAVNVKNAYDLGFASGESSSWSGDRSAIEDLSRTIFSKLACTIMAKWTPPSVAEIRVQNATSMEDWDAIRQAIKTHGGRALRQIGAGQFERSEGQGIILFRVEYEGTSDELSPLFTKMSEHLPFRLDFITKTNETCVFNIVRKS